MRIAILTYENVVETSVMGPADILSALTRLYPRLEERLPRVEFAIDFVRESEGSFWKKTLTTGEEKKLRANDVYDLVIIPSMRSDRIEEVVKKETKIIEWIRRQHLKNAELASICVGAFMLAATGLLDGKKATTNWMFADKFRQMYPEVLMQDDKIIVDQGHIYTCGGAFTFTTFMMYLVEKFCGHEVAIIASKILMINMHQQPQNTFSIFQLQRNHADETVRKAQLLIEKDYSEDISVEKMAAQCNMSIRNFIRRFEQATGNTPLEYLQRVRIEAAKKMLENGNDGIEQIAFRCGYGDMGFFRKIFRRHVSMTPREYQDKYGKSGLRKVTAFK